MEALVRGIDGRVEVTGSAYVAISARDVERAVRFYARVFGFRVIEQRRDADVAHVLLSTQRDTFVAVHDEHAAAAPPPGTLRLTFAVHDLERAREALWNHGVAPVGGHFPEERSFHPANPPHLVIRDPDGNEIDLVEQPYAAAGRSQTGAHAARSGAIAAG